MTTDYRCGKTYSGLRTEHCMVCHETFNSAAAGDKHRIGEFGINRRCRTPEEMRELGMSLNARGAWITDARPAQSEIEAGDLP